jgi:eukaryotic-like serine/threonine-protein kinase
MSERLENIAYCHACGGAMDVSAIAPFSSVECPTCRSETRVKREFGPYTLVSRHAVGGMSMVFIARDNTLNREVALKILSEEFSADERRITAFEEEARITASFSHPHVVRVLRTGKAFERLYIAMELVPGGHFEHQIRERGKIPELEMLPLAIEIAHGLKAAQAAGLIHRDVKPGNILLDAEGHAKLVDFGLALVTQGGLAQATEVWATPYYVPPETIEGEPEDFRSDIYAFGATLYHALAGVPSCGEETMDTATLRLAKQRVVPLSTANPNLTAETCRIVERAMAYRPQARFSSYEEMISQLELALKHLSSGAPGSSETSATISKRRAKKKQQMLMLAGSSAVILLAIAGLAGWWFTRPPVPQQPTAPVVESAPTVQEVDPTALIDIAKKYREARAAVEAREFSKAASDLVKLAENPEVQEPTRSWAGVESVLANFMAGESAAARTQAKTTAAHIASLPDETRLGESLLTTLDRVQAIPAIPAKDLDPSLKDSSQIMAWMLAGIKNWDQGLFGEAAPFFQAVSSAQVSKDQALLVTYQELAKDYLADHQLCTQSVFEALPKDAASCTAAVDELEAILAKLKTRGRARYNIRALQLDIARHGKRLLASKDEVKASVSPAE